MATRGNAQECTPADDGPVAGVHAAVKKPGDPVTVTWTLPTLDECGDALAGETALTYQELYVSVNTPVVDTTVLAATLPANQTTIGLTADANKGADIYYALRSCNNFGCSALSNQEYVKLPGKPQKGNVSEIN